MRADRVGGIFSFICFHAEGDGRMVLDALAESLSVRLRLTDDFGEWQGGIGALLPETPQPRAAELAESVAGQLAPRGKLRWSVLAYPPSDGQLLEMVGPEGEQSQAVEIATPQLFVRPLPLWKRGFDILCASVLLAVAAPLLALAALAIKLSSPGPILFCQRRAGLGGRPFVIYKLRTMRVDAEQQKAALRPLSEQDGPAFKLKNDPRITTVGKYLRKTCIDELPQLWNVLRGDMTLVGPRPLPCDEAAACSAWQQQRLDVTPGLTCIWQVRSGRSRIAFADWMRLDIQYIRGRSLGQDLKLVWKTFLAVLMHRASH